jgi:predicted nucleic acid-binding protein
MRTLFLDTGVLGLLTTPRLSELAIDCKAWFQAMAANGARVVIPEIADYELRRELLRMNRGRGLANLETLISQTEYLPITTAAMRQAAQLWASARQQGQPTAGDRTIDADMILAGQALTFSADNKIIVTTNLKHITRVVPADLWQNIT